MIKQFFHTKEQGHYSIQDRLAEESFGMTMRSTRSREPTPTVQLMPDKPLKHKGKNYSMVGKHHNIKTRNRYFQYKDGSIQYHHIGIFT